MQLNRDQHRVKTGPSAYAFAIEWPRSTQPRETRATKLRRPRKRTRAHPRSRRVGHAFGSQVRTLDSSSSTVSSGSICPRVFVGSGRFGLSDVGTRFGLDRGRGPVPPAAIGRQCPTCISDGESCNGATATRCPGTWGRRKRNSRSAQRSGDSGGTPVFYDTRVPVQTLFDYLEGGETIEEFLEQ